MRTSLEMIFKQAGIKSYVIENSVYGVISMNLSEQPFENALKFLTVLSAAQFIVLIPFVPLIKVPNLDAILIIYTQSLILTVGLLLQFEVLKKLPVSTVAPLNNLMPLFLYSYAFFILGENLSQNQIIGFLVLIVGAYLINFSPKDILFPIKQVFKSKLEQWLIISVMILAAVAMMDKLVFFYRVDVLSFLFLSQLFLAINSLLVLLFIERDKGIRDAFSTKGVWVLLTAILKNAGNLAYLYAVSIAPVSLVLPFRQMSSFFAAIFGGTIFKEKGLKTKAIASIIMISGVLLIIL
ncbi:EamA family transporter [bacterium]|nr:EamA family transporter [bacterium]